jgi:hypothetical protein
MKRMLYIDLITVMQKATLPATEHKSAATNNDYYTKVSLLHLPAIVFVALN